MNGTKSEGAVLSIKKTRRPIDDGPCSCRTLISSQISKKRSEIELSPWIFVFWNESFLDLSPIFFIFDNRFSDPFSFLTQQIAYEGWGGFQTLFKIVYSTLNYSFSFLNLKSPYSFPLSFSILRDIFSHFENIRSTYTSEDQQINLYFQFVQSESFFFCKNDLPNTILRTLSQLNWVQSIGLRLSSRIAQSYYLLLNNKLNSNQEGYN